MGHGRLRSNARIGSGGLLRGLRLRRRGLLFEELSNTECVCSCPVILGAEFNIHHGCALAQVPREAHQGTARSSASYAFRSGGNQSLVEFFCLSLLLEATVQSFAVQRDAPRGAHFPAFMG